MRLPTSLFTICLSARAATIASPPLAQLDGVYFSFQTGGDASAVVDRFEARQLGSRVTFYRNGAVGQTAPIDTATAQAGESYTVEGNTLTGVVTAVVQTNGDIVWSHGYTSRKESPYALSRSCDASRHEVRRSKTPYPSQSSNC
jgi:hypothetical protein